ncbi:erythromycin esterase family protein [Aureivirga sp. CE67]|uniref:erythromycin esterase family protein n=1 Tax=Aureivirga sp. CE67 TaxID=1788983 RepID=UPI0018CAF161|nr:erythromycin esterase family protein [Aureivirga sp. CE67]
MKKINLSIQLSLFIILSVFSQEFNPKIIDIPENPKPEDFSFLKEELKDANVVMLGEFSHFNGDVFIYKAKIAEYLYEELGYKTIAFEGSVYDIYKAEQQIQKGESVDYAFQESLYGVWGGVEEFNLFKKFYDKNKESLKLYGFDCQIVSSYTPEYFVQDLFKFCKKNKLKLDLDFNDLEIIIDIYTSSYKYHNEDISYSEFKNAFEKLLSQIEKLSENEEVFIWKQTIESILVELEDCQKPPKEIKTTFFLSSNDVYRDKKMAENLLEYIEKHPDEKIICWGANAHFMNNMPESHVPNLVGVRSMGTYVKEKLGKKVYSLAAATAFEEHEHRVFDTIVPTPLHPESFERFMRNQKKKHFFISSNQKVMDTMIQTRFLSDTSFVKNNLKNAFDGYLYFDKFKESTAYRTTFNSKLEKEIEYISGIILDEESNEPIPLAEVRLGNNATFSDGDGKYILEKPKYFKKTDSIQVDASGFKFKKTAIGNSAKIKLKIAPNQLSEVVIMANKSPYKIVRKALRKINYNYATKKYNVKNYMHYHSNFKGQTSVDYETVIDSYVNKPNSSFRSAINIQEFQLNEGKKKPEYIDYSSLWYHITLNSKVLKKSRLKKYSLKLENDTLIDNKETYKITFKTDRKSSKYTEKWIPCDFYGNLYINKKDYAIVRVEYFWKTIDPEPNILLDQNEYLSYFLDTEQAIITFKKVNDKYVMDKKIVKGIYMYLDKENVLHPKDHVTKIAFYDYEFENVTKIKYLNMKRGDEINLKKIKYNKEFWDKFERPTFEKI